MLKILSVKNVYIAPLMLGLIISLIGILFIYSTTHNAPQSNLFLKQTIWLAVAVASVIAINRIDYHSIVRLAPFLYGCLISFLALLLVAGKFIGGAKSWFFFKWIAVQPSEFGKIILIIFLAKIVAEMDRPFLRFRDIIKPALYLSIPLLLIAMQPDLGTAITYIPIYFGIIFVARLRIRVLVVLFIIAAILLAASWTFILKPYQKERIKTFFEPEKHKKGSGYQIVQSKIAIGSGGFWGKGYLKGTQSQLNFVPEQHTDFIFSVLAEETGLAGVTLTMLLYFLLLISIYNTAIHARDKMGLLITTGFIFMLSFHFLVNVGMVVGLMPTTGIPLPLVSYGGSSLLSTYIGIGIIMNIRMRRFVNL